eukprot:scaffold3964_cov336-Prasinococcus_capsulatus_cf.AAC.5
MLLPRTLRELEASQGGLPRAAPTAVSKFMPQQRVCAPPCACLEPRASHPVVERALVLSCLLLCDQCVHRCDTTPATCWTPSKSVPCVRACRRRLPLDGLIRSH